MLMRPGISTMKTVKQTNKQKNVFIILSLASQSSALCFYYKENNSPWLELKNLIKVRDLCLMQMEEF